MAEISIIIPAYNAAGFIDPTLESALTQDISDIEVIAVDDGSTDGTLHLLELAAQRDRRIMIVSQPNLGVSEARNAGLRAASPSTTALLFLDHDDVLLPGSLSRLRKALSSDQTAAAAHGMAAVIDEHGEPTSASNAKSFGLARRKLACGASAISAARRGPVDLPDAEPTGFAALVYGPCITSPGQVLIRASALRQTGGFDPAAAPSDDWDLYLRLARIGPLVYLPEPVLGWRRHESNASRDVARMKRSSLAVRSKLLERRSGLDSAAIAIVRRQFSYTAIALMTSALRRDGKTDVRGDLVPALKLYARALFARPAKPRAAS